jgi:hypothetical protein
MDKSDYGDEESAFLGDSGFKETPEPGRRWARVSLAVGIVCFAAVGLLAGRSGVLTLSATNQPFAQLDANYRTELLAIAQVWDEPCQSKDRLVKKLSSMEATMKGSMTMEMLEDAIRQVEVFKTLQKITDKADTVEAIEKVMKAYVDAGGYMSDDQYIKATAKRDSILALEDTSIGYFENLVKHDARAGCEDLESVDFPKGPNTPNCKTISEMDIEVRGERCEKLEENGAPAGFVMAAQGSCQTTCKSCPTVEESIIANLIKATNGDDVQVLIARLDEALKAGVTQDEQAVKNAVIRLGQLSGIRKCGPITPAPTPVVTPAPTPEKERRVDPNDGLPYTFDEFKEKYKDELDEADQLEFWATEYRPLGWERTHKEGTYEDYEE